MLFKSKLVPAFIAIVSFFILFSCSEGDGKKKIKPTKQDKAPQMSGTGGQENVLLFSEVDQNMADLGAAEVDESPSYNPANYSGYDRVIHYQTNAGDGFIVYVWDNPSENGYSYAANDCTKEWNNGDCKGSSDECDVDIVDGEVVITCCDDKAA